MQLPFLLLFPAWAVALSATPQSWTTHNDPAGFTVRHLPGWGVETGDQELVTWTCTS